jgi:hypothetical protein
MRWQGRSRRPPTVIDTRKLTPMLVRRNEGGMPEATAPELEIACAPGITCQVRE